MPIWVYAAIAAVLLALGFGGGVKVEQWHRDSIDLALHQQIDEARDQFAQQQAAAAQQFEQQQEQQHEDAEARIKYINRVVEKPVYRNVCFDADGLRAANAALSGQAANSAGPDAALPAAQPAR